MWSPLPDYSWINEICHQLSRMTGRQIEFVAEDSRAPSLVAGDASDAWSMELHAAQGPVGMLRMAYPRDRKLDNRDLIACKLCDLIGDLLQRSLSSPRKAHSATSRRVAAELKILRQSQPPQDFTSEAAGGWCRIAGRIRSAREVGGDFCECIPLSRQLILLGVGDAAGNSTPAAMIAAVARGALTAIAQSAGYRELRPERILTCLNRVLLGLIGSHQFVTLTLGLLDGSRSILRLATAGHPPPLLFREDEAQRLIVPGLPLGISPEAAYQCREFTLQRGDLLAFYTDGLLDGRDRLNSFASLLRELQIADEKPGGINQLVETVWTALENAGGDEPADDRSLMLVQFEGTGAGCQRHSVPAGRRHRPSTAI